jgi:hypothetical protein
MVNDGHDGSLLVTKLQRSNTFVANYEHLGDFRIESVNGVGGGNLPNDTIIGEVVEFIELLQIKISLQ